MQYLKFFILIIFLFLYCNNDSPIRIPTDIKSQEPFETDIVSFEMAFGSEIYGTKDEFLLVSPGDIHINQNDDILFRDEGKIKVFNKKGIGERIIGRRGWGPGEFESDPDLYLGPSGFLMILSGSDRIGYYNFYSPEYKFIEKRRILNNKSLNNYLISKDPKLKKSSGVSRISPLNESEWIYEAHFPGFINNQEYIALVYKNDNNIIEIFNIKNPRKFTASNGFIYSTGVTGYFSWFLILDRKLMYFNTDDDKHDEQLGSFYTIQVISLDTFEDKQITREFTPVAFNKDIEKDVLVFAKWSTGENRKKQENSLKELAQLYLKRKYYVSVEYVIVDRHYAFVYNSHFVSDRGYSADVFDLNEGKFIKQVIFPTKLLTIKNGYAYDLALDKNGFYEIRKYKLNPIVYGFPEDPDWRTKK